MDINSSAIYEKSSLAIDSSKNAAQKLSTLGMQKDADLKQAKQAAEDFEAFFISQVTESMFQGIETDGMFGGGQAEKIYRSLLIDEYGKSVAKSGGVGVSDQIMDSILDLQEQQSNGYIDGARHGKQW